MAIVWARKYVDSDSADEKVGEGVERSYAERWQVLTDSMADGPDQVLDAQGLPAAYDVMPNDPSAVVVGRKPHREPRQPLLWWVDIDYQRVPGVLGAEGDMDITSWVPGIRIWFVPYSAAVTHDVDGEAIDNSAGEPYDPAPEVERHHLAIEIARNEWLFDLSLARQYIDAVNSDVVWDQPAGSLRIVGIGGTRKSMSIKVGSQVVPRTYYNVRYEIHAAPDLTIDEDAVNWKLAAADAGYYKRPVPAEGLIRMIDDEGIPLSKPGFLNGTGDQLTPGTPRQWNVFEVYKSLPFAPLNLPTLNITG